VKNRHFEEAVAEGIRVTGEGHTAIFIDDPAHAAHAICADDLTGVAEHI
jgi:hypothetical protein